MEREVHLSNLRFKEFPVNHGRSLQFNCGHYKLLLLECGCLELLITIFESGYWPTGPCIYIPQKCSKSYLGSTPPQAQGCETEDPPRKRKMTDIFRRPKNPQLDLSHLPRHSILSGRGRSESYMSYPTHS